MSRTIYAVAHGSYSDHAIDCLFEKREDAEETVRRVTEQNKQNKEWYENYEVEEYQLCDAPTQLVQVFNRRCGVDWRGCIQGEQRWNFWTWPWGEGATPCETVTTWPGSTWIRGTDEGAVNSRYLALREELAK